MKKLLLAFTTLSMLLLSSCDKDDDEDENEEPSVTVESLAGNYKLTGIWVKLNSLPSEVEVTNDRLEDCEKDDIYNLKSDFTYAYLDAGTKCSPPGDGSGTWALPGNNVIHIDGTPFNVVKWDGTELHISQSGTDPATGQSGTVRIVFIRQ